MIAAVGASDIVGIITAAFLLLITSLIGLMVWIFLDTRKQLYNHVNDFRKELTETIKEFKTEMNKRVEVNGRHLDSLMNSVWGLTWRQDSVENFLDETTAYHPTKVPIPPPRT